MFSKLLPDPLTIYRRSGQHQHPTSIKFAFHPDISFNHSTQFLKPNPNVCVLNGMGYIPIISTFTGIYRSLVGLACLVSSLAAMIFHFKNITDYVETLKIGTINVLRGFLEIIPIVGNLFVTNIDLLRITNAWSKGNPGESPYNTLIKHTVFDQIDKIGAFPLVGTISNLCRAIFFGIHFLFNFFMLVTGKEHHKEGLIFSAKQMGIGLLEAIPIVGTVSACIRNHNVYS